jgi:predicted nucleic acid-binding protein
MKLIDSNILIYAAKPEYADLKALLQSDNVAVSDISRLEVLGFHRITEEEKQFFKAIFTLVRIVDVDSHVINKAIEIRQGKNVTVGDAIIAATALLNSFELVTNNVGDFKHLPALTVTNPIDK